MHSYNHGLVTSSKGAAIEFVKVTGLDITPAADAACTVDDCKAGLISSVIHSATGVYDFTLTLPYPPSLVACIPHISNADGTTDLVFPSYDSATYSASAGAFTIRLSNDDDSGAPVLVAGGATDELYLILVFRRYTT